MLKKTKLVRFLLNQTGGPSRAATTIAPMLDTTPADVEKARTQINSDGLYTIESKQGGGLTIKGGADEQAIYPFIEANAENWIAQHIYGKHGVTRQIVEATHKKRLTGKWSTPDFSIACVHKFLHMPGPLLEVVSIEAKHADKQLDISCVYEAFAHTRVSSYSVLFFFESPASTISDKAVVDVFEEIKIECGRLGVGLIVSQYPPEPDTWKYLIPARQQSPDRRRVDAFIEDAFPEAKQKELKKLL